AEGAGSADSRQIILLLGLPRVGKSYTALYHLFRRYCLGEQVFHLPLTAPDSEMERLLKRLHELRARHLARGLGRPVQWVFLEDPFGTITFWRRDSSRFSQNLKDLLDSYVGLVITSRHAPYHQAQNRLRVREMEEVKPYDLGDPYRESRRHPSLYSDE